MRLFRKYLLHLPLNITFESQKFLNGYIIWSTGLTNLTTKEMFLNKIGTLDRQNEIITHSDMAPYLKYHFRLNNTLVQSWSQRLNHLKRKLQANWIGLTIKYQKFLNIRGGYKFTLSTNILVLELGYSHKIVFVWPTLFSNLKLSRRENTLQVKSHDPNLLMSILASLKKIRPLNVYTRKGIKYKNEFLKYKQVKRKKFL